MKEIFVDIERCTACKACEIACAVEHSSSKSLFGAVFEQPAPQKRVHVEPALAYAYPVRCLHCSDARCIAACPNGSLSRDVDSGAVVVNADRCQGCCMCAMGCSCGALPAPPTPRGPGPERARAARYPRPRRAWMGTAGYRQQS